ncbi:hypothetical protein HKX48_003366 [Thoreauomyces humboldtii]|nr:hypothetical protein HKX48_003366 [Thoreauomyces humboldtii]
MHGHLLLPLLVLALCHLVIAHSQATPPIRFYDFVDNIKTSRRSLSAINLSFRAINQTFDLALEQNLDVLHREATFVGGESESADADIATIDLHRLARNLYKGHVVRSEGTTLDSAQIFKQVGWARMYFDASKGVFEGTFTADGEMYHVKDIDVYHKTRRSIDVQVLGSSYRSERHRSSRMILLLDRDQTAAMAEMTDFSQLAARDQPGFVGQHSECGFDYEQQSLAIMNHTDTIERKAASLSRRAPAGCPTSRKVLFMAAAADCTYTKLHGGKEGALAQMLQNWNTASSVYERTFNISLGLIQVQVQDTCTPNDALLTWNRDCSDAYTITDRLSDFSKWRGVKDADQAGLWHLMTNCPTGASVGVAWLKTLCSTSSSAQASSTTSSSTQASNGTTQYVSGTGVSSSVTVEWKVVAHEIGHNFGAIHDCSGLTGQCPCTDPTVCNCCPCADTNCNCDGRFLMHPTDSATTNDFSPCTITTICGGYPKLGTCLQEPGTLTTLTAGICGNGIREGTEQCDCGTASDFCSDKNDECCSSCQLKSNGTVCRSATGVCDITETCNGTSSICPVDLFVADKVTCAIDATTNGQCASGQCTSRDQQCKNQAASLALTGACSDQITECQLFCTSASGCVSLQSYFIDGTPCGYNSNGVCEAGSCSASGILNQALGWIQSHKQIAIPIIILAGLLILSILYSFLRCCCCPPAARQVKQVPLQRTPRQQQQQQQQWVDPQAYNGPDQGLGGGSTHGTYAQRG